MPNPKICNKIADPAARRRCLNYQGEFAEQGAGSTIESAVAPRVGTGRIGARAGVGLGRKRGGGGGGGFGGY